ncbi:MAG: tetratricopeptide repeat protein [Candidatus Krumholzibacteria bacterium]|nr:tetratricopeptide repeat protein [Candidatus Krumholzibacteria bacterium]
MNAGRRSWVLAVLLLLACSGEELSGHLEKGDAFFKDGQWEEARLEAIYVLQRAPKNHRALWLVSRSLLALNRDGEAESYFRTLFEEDPSYRPSASASLDSLARFDYLEGRKGRAARRWLTALDFQPGLDPGPYGFFLAEKYFKRGDHARSAGLYRRAFEAYPDSAEVLDQLYPFALSLERLERLEEARPALERFLQKVRRHPRRHEAIFLYQDLMIRLARRDMDLMDFSSAIRSLDRVLRYSSNPTKREEALLEMGICYEKLGKYGKAVKKYRRIVEENNSGSGRFFEASLERLERLEKADLIDED